mgnify:CR=1 FL=1|tara:strand:+ start:240 stop:683 length:444 start_codon:yes stop_codon:yes gene_type:complete
MSKEKEVNNTTEALAVEFVKNAVRTIEAQLKIEIDRNGFSLEDLRKGKIKLTRTVVSADGNPLFKCESFAIGKRLILAVKWNPGGFTIERNSDAVARAVKINPNFGIKKNAAPGLVLNATKREVEIEAQAQKYMSDFIKENKNLGQA